MRKLQKKYWQSKRISIINGLMNLSLTTISPGNGPAEDERKEEYVTPYLHGMKRSKKMGVYFIFKSMEQGSTFRALNPKYQTDLKDPVNWDC